LEQADADADTDSSSCEGMLSHQQRSTRVSYAQSHVQEEDLDDYDYDDEEEEDDGEEEEESYDDYEQSSKPGGRRPPPRTALSVRSRRKTKTRQISYAPGCERRRRCLSGGAGGFFAADPLKREEGRHVGRKTAFHGS